MIYISLEIILVLMCCLETSLYLVDLWDALIRFMEMSSVGEFKFRLKMIKSFHVEMITVESTIIGW